MPRRKAPYFSMNPHRNLAPSLFAPLIETVSGNNATAAIYEKLEGRSRFQRTLMSLNSNVAVKRPHISGKSSVVFVEGQGRLSIQDLHNSRPCCGKIIYSYQVALPYYHVILIKGRAVGEAEMEQFYKGHRIEVSVWLDGDGWFASVFIYYSKGPQNILVTFAVPDMFKTYDGAIEAGGAAAQKWIDGR
jgi:hypothetical protein